MRSFCDICGQEKDSSNWRSRFEDMEDGRRLVSICGDHFKAISHEFVPDSVKQDRKDRLPDTIQPFRDGDQLSKEYVELYGTKNLDVTDKQVAEAKPVWKDLPGYSRHFVKR